MRCEDGIVAPPLDDRTDRHVLISIIAAMDRNRVIGRENQLPWRLPADLRRFRAITMGKPILMGRLTHESLGRPLPGRENVVLTSDPHYRAEGCTVLTSLDACRRRFAHVPELMVIGGATLYEQLLPEAGRMYLTLVDGEFEGDTWFPAYAAGEWRETARESFDADDRNPCAYAFAVLERVVPPDRVASAAQSTLK